MLTPLYAKIIYSTWLWCVGPTSGCPFNHFWTVHHFLTCCIVLYAITQHICQLPVNFSEGNTFCPWKLNHTTNFYVGSRCCCARVLWLTCATCCRYCLCQITQCLINTSVTVKGTLLIERSLCELGMEFRSCSVRYFNMSAKTSACVRTCVKHAKYISSYNRKCMQLRHIVIRCSRYRIIMW